MTPTTKIGTPQQTPEPISFPSDIVPGNEKEYQAWLKQWTDFIINYGQACFTDRDARNQNCAYGILNHEDYEHITNLFVEPIKDASGNDAVGRNGSGGFKKSLPAKLRPINVIAPKINKMVGRVLGERFDFTAHVVNEDAVSQKLEDFSAEYAKQLTRFARQQSGVADILGGPLVEGDDVEKVIPKDVEEANLSTFQQQNEIQITNGLAYLFSKKSIYLKHKLVEQGLRSYVVTGKMAFDTAIENDPNAIFIPSENLIYELNSNSPFIHHGRYNGYTFSATPQSLIDRCPELTKKEIESIESQFKTLQANGNLNGNSIWWTWNATNRTFNFNPYKVYWCANKRLKVKITANKFDADNPHVHFIDEKEKVKDSDKVEYRYFKTWYECLKIGESIYYQAREIPGQHHPQDEPEIVDGPLVGVIDPNPCPVDLVWPLAELRTESWFTIERLLGQAKGNILVVDEAGGQDVWGQNYNMLAYGVYVTDSSLEGTNGQQMKNAPVTKDMGLSQAVSELMRFIAFIDQNIAEVMGDNDASRGIIKSDQGLGITQNAMQQTQFTLQPYYAVYYTTVEMVLQALCDLMRPAWSGRKKTAYFLGDNGYTFLNLDPGTKWHMADYGLSLMNSVEANQAKQFMIQMAEKYLPVTAEPDLALAIMKMVRAKSDAECERIFKGGVDAIKKIKEQADKMAQANNEASMKAKAESDAADAANEKQKAGAPVQVATINAQSKAELQKDKNQHSEDEMSVQFKNDIMKVMAEIARENETAKIGKADKVPA